MKLRKYGFAALAAVSALALSACSGASETAPTEVAADEVITLKVQGQPSIAAEPMYMGIELGIFEEEGLEIEVVDMPDQSSAFAAVQAGKLDLAFSNTIGVLTAARQNLPLVMVAASDGTNPAAAGVSVEEGRNYTSVGVYVSKESGITDMSGLEGASIAVPELKAQPDATITSVLTENGHDASNIEWLNMSFVPALDALNAGTLDAAFLVSPFTLDADAAGLTRVMNPSLDFFPQNSATSAWVGTSSWVENNPEAVERFQRAIARAAEYSNENLEEVKQHVIERAGLTVSPDQMPQSYWPTAIDVDAMVKIDELLRDINFFDTELDVKSMIVPQAQ